MSAPVVLRSQPEWYVYLDLSPDAIGVPVRATELLEKYHAVTTVRKLLHLSPDKVRSTPQISDATVRAIMQALANIGLPVNGYRRDKTVTLTVQDDDDLGLGDSPDMQLFSVSPNGDQRITHTQEPVAPVAFTPKESRMAKKKATTSVKEVATTDVAALAKVQLAVSRESRNLGPYVAAFSSPVPLPLSSVCFVVLIDTNQQKVVDSFMAYRPHGLDRDVLVYDVTTRRRLTSVEIAQVGGAAVTVELLADYDDIAMFCEPDLVAAVDSTAKAINQALDAFVAGDNGQPAGPAPVQAVEEDVVLGETTPAAETPAAKPAKPATKSEDDAPFATADEEEVEEDEGDGFEEEEYEDDEEVEYEEVEVDEDDDDVEYEDDDEEVEDDDAEYEEVEVDEDDDDAEYEEVEVDEDDDDVEYEEVEVDEDDEDVEYEDEEEEEEGEDLEVLLERASKLSLEQVTPLAIECGVSKKAVSKCTTTAAVCKLIKSVHAG